MTPIIKNGEPIRYGYWATCGECAADDYSDFHEPVTGCSASGQKEQPGMDARVTYWEEQHITCRKAQAAFSPPEPEQLIVVSDGVYERDMVQGVRYASPPHMSG
ncbi:hypothetical protein B0W47_01185 [Komagataeibacter nataicola]|uniref:Uncharacterized protein n=2 Tax=Komagataeibacter nataicola TaxID=265960 RepID=A0A9N7C3V7_9PROT|nr:hypothetical protein B0W47_01185 [Komagataeibacter nataicola]